MRLTAFGHGLLLLVCVACGDDDGGGPPNADAGDRDAGFLLCRVDGDCNDGVFCNGVERCLPGNAAAGDDGCIVGTAPRCDDGLECTTDTCSHVANACRFTPIDADSDGHPALSCVTREGELLGDDCDDNDPNRFPGNPETCTSDTEVHDEDCDSTTVGVRDLDGDTAIDDTCCNGTTCGRDCDDGERRIGPDYPEVCDGLDNDCDGAADTNTISAMWFPDADGDGFGRSDDSPIESCAPVAGRSLFNTDLDDTRASVNPAATETCDGVDNDCDGLTDEDEVCSCGVPGTDPCECISGEVDCVGGLLPRSCVNSHWVTNTACGGLTPICLMGRCVCADGGTRCLDVVDRSAPFVLATAPGTDTLRVLPEASVVVFLSEPPAPATINAANFRVLDDNDVAVVGERTIDGQLVSFTPDAPLLPGHIYRVVFENVSDRAGNAMRSSTSWRFATAVGSYPREVINQGGGIGFSASVLRASPAGDVALWVDTRYFCSDCPNSGEDVYRRTDDGQWVTTGWPSLNPFAEVAPVSLAVGAGGLIAALVMRDQSFELLRQGATDTIWNEVSAAPYVQPAAVTVAGGQVISVAQTVNDLVEVATASGLAALTPNPDLVRIGTTTGLAVAALDASTIAVLMLTVDEVIAAYYAGGTWHVVSTPAAMARDASVQLRADGRAVATWLQGGAIGVPGGGPPLFGLLQHVAFFDASTDALAPIALTTDSIHSAPQVAWLDTTHAIAWHSEEGATPTFFYDPVVHVVALDRSVTPTTVYPSQQLAGESTGLADLAVMPNGDATMVWTHNNSFFGDSVLIARRYVSGVWLPVEAIADSLSPSQPQVEALPNNNSLVVWKQDAPEHGVAIVLP